MAMTMTEYPYVNVPELLREIEHLKSQLALASQDSVTGLPNRGALENELEIRQSRQMRGEAFAVMFVDVDHFKRVNDERGHDAGDAVLRGVARSIQSCIRPHDFVGRYGGEEFVVVIEAEGAGRVAERIRQHVEAMTGVTVSVGVCFWDTPNVSLKSVMVRADAAMYDAKECGRNNVQFANERTHHA